MRQGRRIAAYGVCRDRESRVLLARGAPYCDLPGVWQVPGGGIEHGEHPADAVVREFAEETGLTVQVSRLRAVVADVIPLPRRGVAKHTDRVIYDVEVHGGSLRGERDGTSDLATWVTEAEAAGLPLMPFTAELLGLPVDPAVLRAASVAMQGATGPPQEAATGPDGSARGQRFAAYGLVTDPAGRVLLTLIADGFPGAGRWHLPGGGTDHGEQPVAAFLRELAEEAGQVGRVTGLLDVSHSRIPAAVGPEGYPVDWHAVRALFRAQVDAPTEARVTEAAGGSTARAAWFDRDRAARLRLTQSAARALRLLPTSSHDDGDGCTSELHW
jgi:ADP-ribose pyrophosphatase YjhB (NUDIX family)